VRISAALLLVVLAGCGNHDVSVAPECTESVKVVRTALAQPPVVLRGQTRLSDCFKHAASSADVQTLGAIVIETAHQLGDQVREAPHSQAAFELGLLVGTVRRAATGVHYETGRRVEQELIGLPLNTPEYRRGLAAGLR
jgi:hypothetical protein